MSDYIQLIDAWLRKSAEVLTADQEAKQFFHMHLMQVGSLRELKELLQPSGFIVDDSTPFLQKKKEWYRHLCATERHYERFRYALRENGPCYRHSASLCVYIAQLFAHPSALINGHAYSIVTWEDPDALEEAFSHIDEQMERFGEALKQALEKRRLKHQMIGSFTDRNHAMPKTFADIIPRNKVHEAVIVMLQAVAQGITYCHQDEELVPVAAHDANALLQNLLRMDIDMHQEKTMLAPIEWPVTPIHHLETTLDDDQEGIACVIL